MLKSKILTAIEEIAQKEPNRIAVIGDENESKSEISYSILVEKIKYFAGQLKLLNHQKISLIADNSVEWIIFDLACIEADKTFIPLPHFFTSAQISQIIESQKISAVFCDDLVLIKKVFANISSSDFSSQKSCFEKFYYFENKNFKSQKSKITKITFTSGSTANPKPIALSSQNIDVVVFSLMKKIGAENIVKNLTILPLSILLENIAGVYLPLICGATTITKSLRFVGIKNSSGFDSEAFVNAIKITNPSSFILSPELAKLLIFMVDAKRISPKNFKFIAVGGAKVSSDLIKQAHNLNIPLFQGYGLSEVASVVSLNLNLENKNESVGKILPHLTVKIFDGEILVKGDSLAQNIALDDEGFYATGDLGYLDSEGFLFISGRRKNIFITSMMRNVSPEWVEGEILKSFLISQVAVFGEAMPHNSAVVVAVNSEISFEQIKDEFEKINQSLPDYAQVKNIILADEPFSQKNSMLTGNGRIKRQNIWEKYQKKIKNL